MNAPALRFKDAGLTHTGKVRQANEDALVGRGEAGLWAVADGMGGHENGQWASQTIAEALRAAALAGSFDQDVAAVAGAIHAANGVIHAQAVASGGQMGSTAVALLLAADRFAIFWAGDSRAYLLRGGALHRLTRDHSQVQAMVDAGYLTEAEAEKHPMAHVLSRAVGVQAALELDAITEAPAAGDVFLLCSDGLTRLVSDAEIAAELKAGPAQAAERLLAMCLERGAPDNVTLQVVVCEEATLLALHGGAT